MSKLPTVFLTTSALFLLLILFFCLALILRKFSDGAFGWNAATGAWVQAVFSVGAVIVAALISREFARRTHKDTLEHEMRQQERLAKHAVNAMIVTYFRSQQAATVVAEIAAQSARYLENPEATRKSLELAILKHRIQHAAQSETREGILRLQLPREAFEHFPPEATNPLVRAQSLAAAAVDTEELILSAIDSLQGSQSDRLSIPVPSTQAAARARETQSTYATIAMQLEIFTGKIGFPPEEPNETLRRLLMDSGPGLETDHQASSKG